MVYSTRRFVLYHTLCHFFLVIFSPFSIAITSLGEERANLSAFLYVCSICACFLNLSVSSSPWGLGRAAFFFLLLWQSLDFSLTFVFITLDSKQCVCVVTDWNRLAETVLMNTDNMSLRTTKPTVSLC